MVEKLGSDVAEVNRDSTSIAGVDAARWLKPFPDDRRCVRVMARRHKLRNGINAYFGERLAHEGRVAGPLVRTRRLASICDNKAGKALSSKYAHSDVMAFHRPPKHLSVKKGDDGRAVDADSENRTVRPESPVS